MSDRGALLELYDEIRIAHKALNRFITKTDDITCETQPFEMILDLESMIDTLTYFEWCLIAAYYAETDIAINKEDQGVDKSP